MLTKRCRADASTNQSVRTLYAVLVKSDRIARGRRQRNDRIAHVLVVDTAGADVYALHDEAEQLVSEPHELCGRAPASVAHSPIPRSRKASERGDVAFLRAAVCYHSSAGLRLGAVRGGPPIVCLFLSERRSLLGPVMRLLSAGSRDHQLIACSNGASQHDESICDFSARCNRRSDQPSPCTGFIVGIGCPYWARFVASGVHDMPYRLSRPGDGANPSSASAELSLYRQPAEDDRGIYTPVLDRNAYAHESAGRHAQPCAHGRSGQGRGRIPDEPSNRALMRALTDSATRSSGLLSWGGNRFV